MTRSTAQAGTNYRITAKFYKNGVLSDPFSVQNVLVYNAPSGGDLVTTLSAAQSGTGIWTATWSIPASQGLGVYYDSWTWQALSTMSTQTRQYNFTVVGASSSVSLNPYPINTARNIEGPLFVGLQEIDFFNSVNKELIQKIVGQKITYFCVSEEHTQVNSLYNESISKAVYEPVEINALVLYEPPIQTSTNFSIDTIYSIEVYIHEYELTERNVLCREGDFVQFGNTIYEIKTVTYPQLVFGQINNKVMTKLTCIVSRESNFKIEKE